MSKREGRYGDGGEDTAPIQRRSNNKYDQQLVTASRRRGPEPDQLTRTPVATLQQKTGGMSDTPTATERNQKLTDNSSNSMDTKPRAMAVQGKATNTLQDGKSNLPSKRLLPGTHKDSSPGPKTSHPACATICMTKDTQFDSCSDAYQDLDAARRRAKNKPGYMSAAVPLSTDRDQNAKDALKLDTTRVKLVDQQSQPSIEFESKGLKLAPAVDVENSTLAQRHNERALTAATTKTTTTLTSRQLRDVQRQQDANLRCSDTDDDEEQRGAVAVVGINSRPGGEEEVLADEFDYSPVAPEVPTENDLVEAIAIDEEEDALDITADQNASTDAVVAQPMETLNGRKGFVGWVGNHKLMSSLLLVLILGVIIVGSVLGATQSPTTPPTPYEVVLSQQSSRFKRAAPMALKVTPIEVLLDPFVPTAQFRALAWLANEDEADIEISADREQFVLQRYALAVLFYATGGDSWSDTYGFLSEIDVCDWVGVGPENGIDLGVASCDGDGFVTALRFQNNNLNGTLPDELTSLHSLEVLTFAEDQLLTGGIPGAISTLMNLREIRFTECMLSGTIPPGIGNVTDLEHLAMQNNKLSGTIPKSIGKLTSLGNFFASDNLLTGELPSELGLLTDLRVIYLDKNDLTGTIPSELSSLTSLRQADLSFNALTGGGEILCDIESLIVYMTDCYSQKIPSIAKEIGCPCCSLCCSEFLDGCIGNPAGQRW